MFRLVFLMLGVGALIGVEHKKRPRITRPGTGKNNVSMLGFEIADYEVRLVRRLGPRTVYGAHSTDDELLARLEPLDGTDGGVFRLSGYESPVGPVALASVFYEEVLRGLKMPLGAPVVVSARDCCTQDEMKSIGRVFSSLRLSPTVVPESSCAAAHLASRQRVGTSERVYIVNFRGAAATGTLYEISVEDGEKSKDPVVRRVTMLETARLHGCVPDSEIEKEVVAAVRGCLSERVPHPLSLLPFDRPGDWCADVEEFVYNLSTSLDVIPLVKFSRLEQVYVDRSTGEEHFETALSVDLAALRESIFARLSSGGLLDLPKEARCFYISDYLCRSKVMRDLRPMDRDAVVDGTGVINTPGYLLTDARVVAGTVEVDPMYLGLVDELRTKRDAQAIVSGLEDHLSRLTYLADADFDEIRGLVRRGDGAEAHERSLVGGRTLEDARRIVSSLNALVSRNRKLSIDDALYREERLALERKIRMVEAEGDPRIKERVAEHVSAAKEWLAENGDSRDHAAFSSERMRLTTAHIKASMAVGEMDRRAKEELERKDEASERGAEEGDAPEPGAQDTETDWQTSIEEEMEKEEKLRDGRKVKEEPSKQEL